MVLRKTKFYGYAYSDELAELDFFAKNFKVDEVGGVLVLSWQWMKGLDYKLIKEQLTALNFFVIEDTYLVKRLFGYLQKSKESNIKLNLLGKISQVKKIKFAMNSITFIL